MVLYFLSGCFHTKISALLFTFFANIFAELEIIGYLCVVNRSGYMQYNDKQMLHDCGLYM